MGSGGKIIENTNVESNGTSPLYKYRLDSSTFQTFYGNYTANQSGSPGLSSASIAHSIMLTNEYQFRPLCVGDHILWITSERYTATVGNSSRNVTFNISIPPAVIHAEPPFFVNAYKQVAYDSLYGIGNLMHFSALAAVLLPGFYLFDLILVLIIALDIYLEYRYFRKIWNMRSKNRPPTGTGEIG